MESADNTDNERFVPGTKVRLGPGKNQSPASFPNLRLSVQPSARKV